MTDPHDEGIEERLRAILHAEADSVMPSPEGLEKIRARTEQRRVWWTFGLPWLRPVLAVSAAALIAGSVLVGTPQVREQLLPSSMTSPTGPSGITRERDSDGQAAGELEGPVASDSGTRGQDPRYRPTPADPEADDASPEDDASAASATAACPPTRTPTGRPSGVPEDRDDSGDKDGGAESAGGHERTDCVPTEDPGTPDDTGGTAPDGTDSGGQEGDTNSGGKDDTTETTPSPGTGTNSGETTDAAAESPVPATGTPES